MLVWRLDQRLQDFMFKDRRQACSTVDLYFQNSYWNINKHMLKRIISLHIIKDCFKLISIFTPCAFIDVEMNARTAFDSNLPLVFVFGFNLSSFFNNRQVLLGDVGERCGYWKIIYHLTFEALAN